MGKSRKTQSPPITQVSSNMEYPETVSSRNSGWETGREKEVNILATG